MSNGCPVCLGLGRVVAFGAAEPIVVLCPECAGLRITPASAEDPCQGRAGPPGPLEGFLRQLGPALPAPRPYEPDGSSSEFKRSTS